MIDVALDGNTVILLLTFVVGALLPLLVGLVTTKVTSPARKAVFLAALSFLTSVVSEILNALVTGTHYDLIAGLFKFFTIFVIAVTTYFGIWSRPAASGTSVSSHIVANVGVTQDAPVSVTTLPAPTPIEPTPPVGGAGDSGASSV